MAVERFFLEFISAQFLPIKGYGIGLCYYMVLFGDTKNSFSKKAAFEYTHTYSSTIGDMSDLNSNAWRVDYKSSYS